MRTCAGTSRAKKHKNKMGRQDPAARRVSNLTSVQVERKRAIDRANQQHCQQRKKARLQWLETEVVHLSDQLTAARSRIKELEEQQLFHNTTSIQDQQTPSSQQDLQIISPNLPPSTLPMTSTLVLEGCGAVRDKKDEAAVSVSLDEVDAHRADAIWTVNLRELLDPGQDDELGDIIFEYPLPLPDTPSPLLQFGDIPEWQIVPLHLPPETDMDRFIIDLTNSGRRLQQQTGADELSQAQFPSISSLLNPNLGDDGSKPLTAAMATHVVQKSTIKSVPTRIALMYVLSHLMRWLVCRNKQSFEKLPDFLKPTHLQRTVPHPAWVDVITWPQARDNIIRQKIWTNVSFDEFRLVTGKCMSINWPYTDSGAFLDLGDGQNLVLSPIFESHIRRAENWTLSKATATQFPFMEEFCVGPDMDEPVG